MSFPATPAVAAEPVFLPLIFRAQLITCGVVLAISSVVAGLGAIDSGALRVLFGL